MSAPLLPKGTILKITSWYDNTTANKNNPDPNQWVGWGDRTVDEMGHAWVNITYMSDEDFKAELERRKTAPCRAASALAAPSAKCAVLSPPRCSRASCWSRAWIVVARGQGASGAADRAGQGIRAERDRRIRGLVPEPPTAPTRCSSATSTATRNRRSTFRSGPTTGSSPAVPISVSPRTSSRAGNGASSRSIVPKDFGKQRLTWTIVANGQTTSDSVAPRSAVDRRAVQGCGARQHAARAFGLTTEGRGAAGSTEGNQRDLHRDSVDAARVERLGVRRRDTGAGGTTARAPGDRGVEQVPRTRRRDVQQRGAIRGREDRSVDDDRDVQRLGEYILRVQVNDATGEGGGGFQCCWTNAHVKVTVK